jgi:membrane-associated PAP2 superfamily phosphatase
MMSSRTFLLQHAALPGFLLGMALVLIYHYRIDYKLADDLFHLEGNHWALRHQWLFEKVFHDGGKVLSSFIAFGISGLLVASFFRDDIKPFRRGLVFLVCSPLLSVMLVNIFKAISGTPCPAELLRYGGSRFLQEGWSLSLLGRSGCTPAGHSSSGYAWLTLYFFVLVYFPRWRFHALLPGLCLGVIFGITQQLRGEHFLSHDLLTIAICWYSSLFSYLFFFKGDNITINLRE